MAGPIFTWLVSTRKQRGLAIFLAANLLLFAALFVHYLFLRARTPVWPANFHFASGLMAFSITLFACAGSFAMHYAVQHQIKASYEVAMRLVAATVAVWACVTILIAMEWVRLIVILEITFSSSVFASTYFTLTGYYLVHVLSGLVYLTVVASRIKVSDAVAAALFVHFTNLLWLILFVGVYLASTDLQGI